MFKIIIEGQEIPNETCYIIGKKGIFLKKKFDLIESITKVEGISFLNDVDQQVSMNIKKIDIKSTMKILSFFKWVWDTYHSEAIIILHYNPKNKKYLLEAPNQVVSQSNINYDSDLSYPNYLRIGTIHSHGSMSAFHSQTDVHDEIDWDGIHITFGNINKPDYSVKTSIVSNGFRKVVDNEKYLYNIENNLDDCFPEIWKTMVTKFEHPVQNILTSYVNNMNTNLINNFEKCENYNPCKNCIHFDFIKMKYDIEDEEDEEEDEEEDDDSLFLIFKRKNIYYEYKNYRVRWDW